MIKDALSHVLLMKMKFLSKDKIQDTETLEGQNKIYWEYLDRKEKNYMQIENSLKKLDCGEEGVNATRG
jgi:hypothetical protein